VIRFLDGGVSNTVSSLAILFGVCDSVGHLLPHSSKALIAELAFVAGCRRRSGLRLRSSATSTSSSARMGNYLKEWLRCFAVYSGDVSDGLVILPTATDVFFAHGHDTAVCAVSGGIVNSGIYCLLQLFWAQEVFV